MRGKKGSMQYWIDSKMSEAERIEKKLRPPSQLEWEEQVARIRMFDNLIYNTDRHLNNLRITEDWKIRLIDHSRIVSSVRAVERSEAAHPVFPRTAGKDRAAQRTPAQGTTRKVPHALSDSRAVETSYRHGGVVQKTGCRKGCRSVLYR